MKPPRPEEAPADLLHLLTCPTCRSHAIGRLLGEGSTPDADDTQEEIYAGAFARMARETPELIERARRRREAVEALAAELMEAPPGRRSRRLQAARFRNPELLDWLLEVSHARQLSDPAQAAHLARLAARLAALLRGDPEAMAALPRAFCLAANASRLDGRRAAADAALVRASLFLPDPAERAFHCRTLAVLRWEQGRADEARALLQHATHLYTTEELDRDAALCWTLLGLHLLETGEPGDALPLLARGWSGMERDLQPLLALRGGLALAACLAKVDQRDRASGVLREAWPLYSKVKDAAEMVRVYAWEGRALAALGQAEEAMHLLDSVRRKLLDEPALAEATLTTLDLALLLAANSRSAEIDSLVADLEARFPGTALRKVALEGLRALTHQTHGTLAEAGYAIEVTLRRAFRICGERMRPLPVV
jgi:tetratricopeptide (TPR) repeat protein